MNSLPGFLDAPLNLEDPRARAFLDNVQGNILKAHSRNYVAAVFLAFNTNRQAARDWIAGPLLGRVFSAAGQQADIARWKASARVDTPFAAFLLSFPGYFRLDIPDAAIPKDPYFRVGMKASPAGAPDVVADPSVDKWEPPFQQRIDALVLLADGNAARLDATVDEVLAELRPLTEQTFVERGRKLLFDFGDRKGVEIENFGHQDGISLPQLIKQDAEKEIADRGGNNWDPSAPLSLAFAQEPDPDAGYGSYFVFRKLEQRVKSFHDARDGLAATLGVDSELASALAVGRYRDGRPVIPTSVSVAGADPNNFNFGVDADAKVCPFQAHIRKTNPRGDTVRVLGATEAFERSNLILRRGISYGERPDLAPGSTAPTPDAGVGLLFMCYQAGIRQFAIQQAGSDSNDFVKQDVGPDAVIGNNVQPTSQNWPKAGNASAKFTMANFVSFKGGEYFFAPSLGFLRSLSTNAA